MKSQRIQKGKAPEREKTRTLPSITPTGGIVQLSEALVKYSLPLSPEIVATAIARYDNGGAACCGQGEGWDKKGREL